MTRNSVITALQEIYGEAFSSRTADLNVVSKDESSNAPVIPLAVVWPTKVEEIVRTVRLCFDQKTPITVRGAGSALEGSAIPVANGIVLDVTRMNKVLQFWPDDLQVQVQPGIVYDHLNDYLKRDGLFFPPSPGGSGDFATIGGMVSTNASGIYSVKYGGTREYVLSMEIVTGEGTLLKIGSRAVKRSSGYNLVDLLSGSEGTLGVITSVTLRLAGLPEHRAQSAYSFPSEESAAKAVFDMKRSGTDLAAVEFLDSNVTSALNKLKDYKLESAPLLFLEFHGTKESAESHRALADELCRQHQGQSISLKEGQSPWEIRHWVTESIRLYQPGLSILRNDIAFPISQLPELVRYCHQLGKEHKLTLFTFGHVGNGILHALMLAKKDSPEWNTAQKVNETIVKRCVDLGGTVSGEHGIGLGLKSLFAYEHGGAVDFMRGIKRHFDPGNILNPGKIF